MDRNQLIAEIVTFIITWGLIFWVVIFIALPIKVQISKKDDNNIASHSSIPSNPHIKEKIYISMLVSFFLAFLFQLNDHYHYIELRSLLGVD